MIHALPACSDVILAVTRTGTILRSPPGKKCSKMT
jgi:hypothetical protein